MALSPSPRGASATTPGAGGRRRRRPTSVGAWPVLFIGPLMAGVAVFYYWPIVKNLVVSLQQRNAFGGSPRWVGLQNYQDVLSSPDLGSAMANTSWASRCRWPWPP